MKEEIKSYILTILNKYNDWKSLADDEPLMTSHLLDSMDVVDLLYFIEESYGVSVAAHGGDFNELDTVNKIVDYVKKNSE